MALPSKGCNRSQMLTDALGAFAAQALLVSMSSIQARGIVSRFVATHRLTDRHNMCEGDLVNFLRRINCFAFSVFSANMSIRSTSFWTCDCHFCFKRGHFLRLYLRYQLIC